MRVIAGKFRGLTLETLKSQATRPTTDLVKESLFNIIQGYFPSGKVLDLFAGSGALGFEALSRGAEHCVFVENSGQAVQIIRKNAERLKLDKSEFNIVNRDSEAYIKSANIQFDVIFLDPPYNKRYLVKVIDIIRENGLLTAVGILAVETEVGGEEIAFDGFEIVKQKRYGRVLITILRGSDIA